jgi:hypothetical protein
MKNKSMTYMDTDTISGITFPGRWISGEDRDMAFREHTILDFICSSLNEAIVSANEYVKIINSEEKLESHERLDEKQKCKKQIFAKSFVYCLDSISKHLKKLDGKVGKEAEKNILYEKYKMEFGELKHIRDSSMHMEDRGLGLDRNKKPLKTYVVVTGGFINNDYSFSGNDGKHYQIEISKGKVFKAVEIIQELINSYDWES